ncbi:MAG: tetratricopeptide repeat protein, partial [Acidobacteriota bacterium]
LASLHHLLARQARQVGHPSEVQHVADARRLYAEAREADPLDPDPINNSGGLEEEFGQLATAQALYAEALRLNPTGVDAVMNLAGSLARERRFDEARERLQAFLELSPGAMDVRQLLERIDLVVARIADPEGALAMLEAQLSERSTDPDFLFELAALYEETGRLEQACRSFQAAQLLRPEDPRFQAQARRACRLSESRDGPSGR